jgi:hypothetical protein
MVRIIKKMRYLMQDSCYSSANNVSSFELESLLWNIPDSEFTTHTSYGYIFGNMIAYINNNKNSLCSYKEANGIKLLCPNATKITNLREFISDLQLFYQYDV